MSLLRALGGRLSWRLVLLWLLLIGALWLFVGFADRVYEQEGFFFDEPVLTWFYELRRPLLTSVFYGFSVVGDVPATVGISVVVAALLWWKLRRETMFFLLAMGGASLIMVITKTWLDRARPELFPDGALYPTHSPSFPSGHATGSVALYLTLYLIARRRAPRLAPLVGLTGAAMVAIVSASRLYLQVHYPSDILAGLALGAGWVLGVHTLYYRDRRGRFLLLKLPDALVERFEARAHLLGLEEDELARHLLERGLEGPSSPERRQDE